MLSFAVRHLSALGGIMITASHNPKEYNGFKAYNHTGAQLNLEEADQVIKAINAIEDVFAIDTMDDSRIKTIDASFDDLYLNQIASVCPLSGNKHLHIIYSPLHGTGGTVIPKLLSEKGAHKMPLNVRAFPVAATAGAISQLFGFQVSAMTISSCCPSGLDAVCEAARLIKDGRSDIVLAGATDSYVTPVTVASFSAIKLTSSSTDFPPEEICRPFDKKRTGVVFAEGAGVLVLERLDSALARGATPLLEIVSGARFTDSVDGGSLDGMHRSMDTALKNAGIYPEQIDYICANCQGHPEMDPLEVKMIKKVFGEHAYRIPVSSIRGVMGHALASAALMQLITCALAMKYQLIPPTANLTDADPECDLDHVPLIPRKANVNVALVNSHGMAAENSTLVVRRP